MTPPAQTSQQSFWLRAFQISITTPASTTPFVITNTGNESLHVEFSIDQYIYPLKAFWQSTVTIYNLNQATTGSIKAGTTNLANLLQFGTPLNMGDYISISGGYQYGSSGAFTPANSLLYTGRIFQSIITRVNVVDWKMTLHCISALAEDILNGTNLCIAPGTSDYQKIQSVCAGPGGGSSSAGSTSGSGTQNQIPIANIDANASSILSDAIQPGAQSLFGRPFNIIGETAKQHNLYTWLSPNGLNIRSFGPTDFQDTPAYAYGPPNLPGGNSSYAPNGTTTGLIKQTLLGVPQQTQDGVTFRVLMDSTPKVGDLVQLAPATIIQAQQLQYGGTQTPPIPSQTGVYIVGGLHHYGDNRGKDDSWYTEIYGLSVDYFTNFLGARSLGAVLSNIGSMTMSVL